MLTKKETFATLQVLKRGRAEMVQDFLVHKPDIYAPSFKYEDSPVLLKWARDRYFTTWLSSHWKIFSHEATFFAGKQKETEAVFARVFLELLSKWSIAKTTDLNLGLELVNGLENALSLFIKGGDNAEIMLNKIKVAEAKSDALFRRMFEQLSGEKL